MNGELDDFEKLVQILNEITAKMASMHEPAFDFGTGVPLYRSEIHTIKCIGDNPGINITGLAENMGVTKGAVSQTINKLLDKGLVVKASADDNAREILPQLTELGLNGYKQHELFHMQMFDAVHEYYGGKFRYELKRFIRVMSDLNRILDRFEEKGLQK